jgi:ATP-dependent Lon protease
LPPHPLTISTFSFPLLPSPATSDNDLLPIATKLLPKQLHDRLQIVPPSLLADILVTVLGVSWELRAELLGVADVEERIARVKEILAGMLADRGIVSDKEEKKGSAVVPSRALVKRSNRPAQPASRSGVAMSEDLEALQRTFEQRNEEISKAAREAVQRELGRLSGMQPQSAEYSLIRTYVEWLLALPWKKVTQLDDSLDLEGARKKLDDEHEGLEGVKRRVIEYLAVYR